MNLNIYDEMITLESIGILSGKTSGVILWSNLDNIPVIQAFLNDDELQEMTVCSTNIGFVKKE